MAKRQQITAMRGLPGSGKTTRALEIVEQQRQYGRKTVRVNNDDLRAMLFGGTSEYNKTEAGILTDARKALIKRSLEEGYDVVVDNCNLFAAQADELRLLSQVTGAILAWEDLTVKVSLQEALKRNAQRPKPVDEKVIIKMAQDARLADAPPLAYDPPVDAPRAIIVDIDGTLALHGSRNPYDTTRYHEDTLNVPVARVMDMAVSKGHEVIIVSGRDDTYRDVTIKWLARFGIKPTELFMRKAGDRRADSEIKREIFEESIRDHYDIQFVLDDRNRVVKMWRQLGLTCLQVAEGNF